MTADDLRRLSKEAAPGPIRTAIRQELRKPDCDHVHVSYPEADIDAILQGLKRAGFAIVPAEFRNHADAIADLIEAAPRFKAAVHRWQALENHRIAGREVPAADFDSCVAEIQAADEQFAAALSALEEGK